MSDFSPEDIYKEMMQAGSDWADKNAAANFLEEAKKSMLSKLKLKSDERTDAAKETEALASDAYEEHLKAMTDARMKADLAKVRYDAVKALSDNRRTQESTKRAEMQLR